MPCLIVALLALSAGGCANTQTGPDAIAGKPFELKAGVTASLPNGTRLTFERVKEDSRCPSGAQCIWAGVAVVTVRLQAPKGEPESRDVQMQPSEGVAFDAYSISLTALAPHPGQGGKRHRPTMWRPSSSM